MSKLLAHARAIVRLTSGGVDIVERGNPLPDDVEPSEITRLEDAGALVDAEELEHINSQLGAPNPVPYSAAAEEESATASEFDAETASVTEIAEHIASEKLKVDETVALAGDDKDLAAKVLEAESTSHGGDPRAGVESKLQALIDSE